MNMVRSEDVEIYTDSKYSLGATISVVALLRVT